MSNMKKPLNYLKVILFAIISLNMLTLSFTRAMHNEYDEGYFQPFNSRSSNCHDVSEQEEDLSSTKETIRQTLLQLMLLLI